MLHHLLNFLSDALSELPNVLASNWLSLLLPLITWILREGWKILKGWPAVKKDLLRDTLILLSVYFAIFLWSLVRDVYRDHEQGVTREKELLMQMRSNEADASLAATTSRNNLQAQQIACAKLEGANTTLVAQNRAQQSSIDSCQNQALRLLRPSPFKIYTKIAPVGGLTDASNKSITTAIVVVSANDAMGSIAGTLSCNRDFKVVTWGTTVASHMLLMDGTGKIKPNAFPVNWITPQLGRSDNLVFLLGYTYQQGEDLNCKFEER